MNIRSLRAAAAALLVATSGCGITTPDVSGDGTVRFIAIEGGCWTIESGGEIYEPTNLPESMRQDGLEVEFVAVDRDDLFSICQIGQTVDLLRIEPAG